MVQLEKKIIELDAVNVEHGLRYTQLEEQVTQLEESVTLQLKNQNPQLQVRLGFSCLNKTFLFIFFDRLDGDGRRFGIKSSSTGSQSATTGNAYGRFESHSQVERGCRGENVWTWTKRQSAGDEDEWTWAKRFSAGNQVEWTAVKRSFEENSGTRAWNPTGGIVTSISSTGKFKIKFAVQHSNPHSIIGKERQPENLQRNSLEWPVFSIRNVLDWSGWPGSWRWLHLRPLRHDNRYSTLLVIPNWPEKPLNFVFGVSIGTTSVPHDTESPTNVGHCAEPGCYSRTINYNATSKQLSALAELSIECHQSIVVSEILLYTAIIYIA